MISGMARAVRNHPLGGAAVREGLAELSARWE